MSTSERLSTALVVSTTVPKASASPRLKLLPEAAPVAVVVSLPV